MHGVEELTDAWGKMQVWSYAKHILYQYRGVSQYHFPLYLKEVEYRVTHRQENVFKQFLKIYCGGVCRSSSPLFLSFPRTREGGFTFEVQQVVPKNLGWGLIAEAFSRSIIICLDEACKVLLREGRQVGLARQGPAQAADGVLDAALLPGRMGLTEEGLEAESMEGVMPRKLRPVIEGDRLAPGGRQGRQQGLHGLGDGGGGFAGGPRGNQQAGVAFMQGQDGLAVDPEQHQIGLPVPGGAAIRDGVRPLGQRAAQGDEGCRAAAFEATRRPRFVLARGR